MPFNQSLTGAVEPPDPSFLSAPATARAAFYRRAGDVALERLKIQLSRGVGANGRAMRPRKQAVLPDGSDGPVLEPRYDASRVITLSDYQATSDGLTLFWHAGTGHQSHRKARKAGGKPTPFGDILSYHADGLVRGAPARDVRLSKASIRQIKLEMAGWWKANGPAESRIGRQAEYLYPVPTPRPLVALPRDRIAWREPARLADPMRSKREAHAEKLRAKAAKPSRRTAQRPQPQPSPN